MTRQVFIPCYYGSELSAASDKLSSQLFYSHWMIKNKKFKSAIKIFMENVKKPILVKTALGMFKVDLTTFMWICNSAYTIFNVLKSFK
jgi:maltodextrin utilization protein YvdJ